MYSSSACGNCGSLIPDGCQMLGPILKSIQLIFLEVGIFPTQSMLAKSYPVGRELSTLFPQKIVK